MAVNVPRFALCPAAHRTTCAVGSLPAYQAFEMLVTDHVRKKATPGEQIGLTVVVQGSGRRSSGDTLSPAEAAVSTVLDQASSSPAPLPPVVGSVPTSVPGLPGTTVTPPGDITSLFPVVTPSGSPTPSKPGQEKRKVTKATSTASSLPLDSRLIGGQVAGLAVLAAAITMVVARLSLRTPQTASASRSGPTAAAPPPEPSPADAETDASEADSGTDADSAS